MSRGGLKSNVTPHTEPSHQRLARITAALNGERDSMQDSEHSASNLKCVPSELDLYPSQPRSPETLIEHDLPRKATHDSDTLLNEDEQEEELFEATEAEETTRLGDEEAEMRRTVQVLFELEETLLDQHISNIKVSEPLSFRVSILSLSLISNRLIV